MRSALPSVLFPRPLLRPLVQRRVCSPSTLAVPAEASASRAHFTSLEAQLHACRSVQQVGAAAFTRTFSRPASSYFNDRVFTLSQVEFPGVAMRVA